MLTKIKANFYGDLIVWAVLVFHLWMATFLLVDSGPYPTSSALRSMVADLPPHVWSLILGLVSLSAFLAIAKYQGIAALTLLLPQQIITYMMIVYQYVNWIHQGQTMLTMVGAIPLAIPIAIIHTIRLLHGSRRW